MRSCEQSPLVEITRPTVDSRKGFSIVCDAEVHFSRRCKPSREKATQNSGTREIGEGDEEGRWNACFSYRNITTPIISYATKHINSEHLDWQSRRANNHWNVNMVVFPTSKLNIPLVFRFLCRRPRTLQRVPPLLFICSCKQIKCNCTLEQQQSS